MKAQRADLSEWLSVAGLLASAIVILALTAP